jgi:Protein of unknown function (DUF1232)
MPFLRSNSPGKLRDARGERRERLRQGGMVKGRGIFHLKFLDGLLYTVNTTKIGRCVFTTEWMVIYTFFFEINLSVLIYEIEGLSMKNKFFTQMLQDGIRKALRNPKYRWLTILAALFYLISPLDIIPDAIPILGWIDDGIILKSIPLKRVLSLMLMLSL